jgi:hypothetical protein
MTKRAGKEKLGHTPKKGEGRANQLDSFSTVNEIPPFRRKSINPNKIPANIEAVCKNPLDQWERKETKKMIKREDPETSKSP